MEAGRTCLLFNPRAGSAAQLAAVRDRLTGDGVDLFELGLGDDLVELALRAAEDGYDRIVVAGGDGTVHAAANGLTRASRRATLVVLPLGTGNDFCRTIGVPLDPFAAAELLRTGTARDLDVARIDGGPGGYLVNAATGGFSGVVAAEVTPAIKAAWGPLAYLRGALGPVADPPVYRLTVRCDDGPPRTVRALNVVVANARTAAGGFVVAPTADPEDGLLDVVIVHASGALDLSVVAARLMHGNYTHDENVTHRRARRVEIASDPPLPMSLDGERCECDRVAFTVVPKAVRVLTGPGYSPRSAPLPPVEAEGAPAGAGAPTRVSARLFGLLAAGLLLLKRMPGWVTTGLGVAAAATVLFGWVARGVARQEWRAWDSAVLTAQHAAATPELDRLALALTTLGDPAVTAILGLVLIAGFLWRKHYLTAATLVAVLLGVGVLELVLKPLFGNARPDLFPRTVEAGGYSFPSGHALRGVGLFGSLAALAAARGRDRRQVGWWLVALGCAAVAAGVCWSRVYLGVHWPTDVIGGVLAAVAWVAACLVARRYAMRRPHRGAGATDSPRSVPQPGVGGAQNAGAAGERV